MAELIGGAAARTGILLLFLTSLTLAGRALRRRVGVPMDESPAALLWDLTLGTTAFAVVVSAGGFLGMYRAGFFIALLLLGPLVEGRRLLSSSALRWKPPRRPADGPKRLTVCAVTVCLLLSGAGTLVPETFYDALYYHLGLPSQHLLDGWITARSEVVHSAFPALHGSLLGALLAFGGPPLSRMMSAAVHLFAALSCGMLAGLLFGAGRGFAAILLASIPGIVIMSAMTNVDTAVLWYATMAAAGTAQALRVSGEERRRWTVMAAVPLGMAIGSKYPALFLIPALAATCLLDGSCRPGERLRTALLLSSLSLLIGSPWYLRNLFFYGNPFYPVMESLLGHSERGAWAVANLARDIPRFALSGEGMRSFLSAFFFQEPRLGAGAELGQGIYLILPAALAALGTQKLFRPFMAGAALYGLLWAAYHPAVRYLYPCLALLAAAGGWALSLIWRRGRQARILVTFFVAVLLAANLSTAATVLVEQFGGQRLLSRYFRGGISREDYLSTMLPYYGMARWTGENLPADSVVFFLGETRSLYFERPVLFTSAYDRNPLSEWLRESPSAESLHRRIAREGVSHILINATEVSRLNKAYGYLDLEEMEAALLNELLRRCTPVVSMGELHLFAL